MRPTRATRCWPGRCATMSRSSAGRFYASSPAEKIGPTNPPMPCSPKRWRPEKSRFSSSAPSREGKGRRFKIEGLNHSTRPHFNRRIIMAKNTVRLHRVLRSTPERIYRAFLDPDAMAKWLPPNGFTGKVHHLDAKVGGTKKKTNTNNTNKHNHTNGGEYLELVPNERIVHTDKFDGPNLPGEMQVTIALKQVSVGTELNITQEGIPDVIPLEACYLGWQESLTLLAKLVESEIPG